VYGTVCYLYPVLVYTGAWSYGQWKCDLIILLVIHMKFMDVNLKYVILYTIVILCSVLEMDNGLNNVNRYVT
jgi:hypothetical protein